MQQRSGVHLYLAFLLYNWESVLYEEYVVRMIHCCFLTVVANCRITSLQHSAGTMVPFQAESLLGKRDASKDNSEITVF